MIRPLNSAHYLCVIGVTTMSLFVDGNGRVFGLGHTLSLVVTFTVFAIAGGVAILSLCTCRGWRRLIAVASLIYYAALLLPTWAWW